MTVFRSIISKNIAVIILIFIIGFYLVTKAVPENSWDGWRVGSAQTLLSNKQWVKNGFLKNYFLFLPQGYSKTVKYFDDLELRQHARGLATGGFIGRRFRYTHYPSGYLVPTASLMKFGVENRFWLRFLEILFSLAALVFMYWFLNLVSNQMIAFVGTLFYGISTLFLDYADSLANQPIDDIWRFAIITLSIFSIKKAKYRNLNYLIWVLYFFASASSYDSTFFIFAWLVGLDLIIARKIYPEQSRRIEWKKWIFWASAPVLALGIQILQNTLYLGWHNMLLDIFGTFKVQMIGSRNGFFISHLKRLIEPFGWFLSVPWYLGIIISVFVIWCLKIIKKYLNEEVLDIKYLYLALGAILFHFLFFPSLFFYQGRLVAVFAVLLIGSLTISSVKALFKKELKMNIRIIFVIIFIVTSSIWLVQIKRTYAYLKAWPNNIWPVEKIGFDKKIKNLISGDKVVFQISGIDSKIIGPDRYPAAASEDEYYTDAPILGFTNVNDLIRDLNYLKNRSIFPFHSVIITDQIANINKIQTALIEISKKIVPPLIIDKKFVLIIP